MIVYRETMETNTPWYFLATNVPAATGTNRTSFVHTNGADCSGGGGMGMMTPAGSGGGSMAETISEQSVGCESKDSTSGTTDSYQFPAFPWDKETQEKIAATFPGLLPLLPWDEETQKQIIFYYEQSKSNSSSSQGGVAVMSSESGGGGCKVSGFYKVLRVGTWIEHLTNNMPVSGLLLVGVEAGHPDGELQSVTLTIDGSPVPHSARKISPFGDRYFVADTTRYSNGEHEIQAHSTFVLKDITGDDVPFLLVDSPAITLQFTNVVTFEEWSELFGETNCCFTIHSTIFAANWQIQIVNEQQVLLKTLSGQTTNGLIDVQWDLRNSQGQLQTSGVFNSSVTITALNTNAGPNQATQQAPVKLQQVKNWPGVGQWVFARQLLFTNYNNSEDFYDIMDSVVALGVEWGIQPPQPPRQSGKPWYIHYTNDLASTRSNDWNVLRQALSNSVVRNFYYFGHGGTFLGNDFPYGIDSGEMSILLKISLPNHPNYRPLRFAWLDGCATAADDWATQFGIQARPDVSLDFYKTNGTRPGAFCGFANSIYARNHYTPDNTLDLDFAYYRSNFVFYWQEIGATLKSSHQQADQLTPEQDPDYPFHSYLKIYGYSELLYGQYNQPDDWPLP